MIHLQGTAYGYGLHVGIIDIVGEDAQLSSLTSKRNCVLCLPFLPSIATFNKTAMTPGVEFLIIPPCSSYSHLAAAIWSTGVPTMTIQQPLRLSNGVTVLADCDQGLLLVAESESDAESLRERAGERVRVCQARTFEAKTQNMSISRSKISILAEAASARDVHRALADGADGLSVVKGEQLFGGSNGRNAETEALICAVKANPHVFPLPVRFFDQESDSDDGKSHVPHRYLGYRGVRLLERSDTLLGQFVKGLEKLDLEEIIIVLPMVTSALEVRRIRGQLDLKWHRLGVTVETPAAALKIEELLEVSKFIEIGLNDLTQYTMAWDRDIPNQERLPVDRIAAPVADLICFVAAACNTAGVPYTLGMDLRPNEGLAAQILQLGVRCISCAPCLIRPWKDVIASQATSQNSTA